MDNYALIQNGVVINVVLVEGTPTFDPGAGLTLVLIPDGSLAWIGWGWTQAGGFTSPTE